MEVNKENPSKSAKPPSPSGCKINVHPQQQEFNFNELTLDSCFDSGNMANASRVSESQYHIYIAPDCVGTPRETDYRTWFYFRARDIKRHSTTTFTIKNMNFQMKLYNEGLLPVYKTSSNPVWKKVDAKTLSIFKHEKGIEVSFRYTFKSNDEEVFFAFTYPWSYTEDQELINQYELEYKEDSEIYFNRELLAYSKENRRIELLTITSHSKKLEQREPTLPNLFPGEKSRPFMFNKKYVFISSRVHPGETPGSHVFNGFLKFLLNREDPRAQALRENFVIVLIPMLNPDGVYRGHYRTDTNGLNLNRYYINPSSTDHPTIYATRQMVLHLNNTKRLYLYCDLHAHATKRGCFVYGNSMDFRQQVETLLFPKVLSLNSEYFEYETCDFSEKNVNVKDRGDGKNKEGAGRVALHKATDLPRCYTLECNYASGKYKNVLSACPPPSGSSQQEEEKSLREGETPDSLTVEKANARESYFLEDFEEIGEGMGPTLLDMINSNPCSRISTTVYRSLKNVKLNLALTLLKEPPYRFDVYLRKLNKNIAKNYDHLLKYLDENIKTDPLADPTRKENTSRHRISRTVPPQVKKRPLNESKEATNPIVPPPVEIRGLKEIKVINILPPIRTSGTMESRNELRKQKTMKPMLNRKATINLPPKNGLSVIKKLLKGS